MPLNELRLDMNREQAERHLQPLSPGAFIVRESSKAGYVYGYVSQPHIPTPTRSSAFHVYPIPRGHSISFIITNPLFPISSAPFFFCPLLITIFQCALGCVPLSRPSRSAHSTDVLASRRFYTLSIRQGGAAKPYFHQLVQTAKLGNPPTLK